MAWSIPTYAGVRAIGSPSNYRLGMFELIRGVYERYEAIGFGQFGATYALPTWLTNTTGKQRPTMADLLGIKCTGSSATAAGQNRAMYNLKLIRDRIVGLIEQERFLTTDGGSTFWTVETLESEIGASLDYPTKINEARAWQAYQDALDRMIYAYTPLECGGKTNGVTSTVSDKYSTHQDAWDNISESGSIVQTGLVTSVGWGISNVFTPPDSYMASQAHTHELYFYSGVASNVGAIIYGSVTSAEYEYLATFDGYTDASFAVSINGNTISASGSGTGTATATAATGSEIEQTLTVSTSIPSTIPFSDPSFGTANEVAIRITGLNIKHNISSYLTDQAP